MLNRITTRRLHGRLLFLLNSDCWSCLQIYTVWYSVLLYITDNAEESCGYSKYLDKNTNNFCLNCEFLFLTTNAPPAIIPSRGRLISWSPISPTRIALNQFSLSMNNVLFQQTQSHMIMIPAIMTNDYDQL